MTRPYSAANYNQFPMDKLIINIGRQFGSGGKCVAVEIGKKLDIKVYDNTLISKAAQESGFSQDFFRDRDEYFILDLKTLFEPVVYDSSVYFPQKPEDSAKDTSAVRDTVKTSDENK